MQVHSDDMIGASAGQKVGDKSAGLGYPLLIARLWLEHRDFGGIGSRMAIVIVMLVVCR